ncbi:MAG TPA: TlpA disulfide reductase family protein [Longimicrobiaceae bacterium]|nr:TlpA disulfide reductase family protein [Longimicrobiaceae bacterium]
MMDRIGRILPVVALAVAAALVVVLSLKVRDQNDRYARLYQRATQPYAGMFVPTFQASTLDGAPVTVGESPASGRQVLFVFTTTCPYCMTTLPAWREITAALDTVRSVPVQVYGIALDSVDATRRYLAENRLSFPVVRFPEDKLASLYRAQSVPLTVVLDERGRVIHSRLGEMKERAAIDSVLAAVHRPTEPRRKAPAPASTAGR